MPFAPLAVKFCYRFARRSLARLCVERLKVALDAFGGTRVSAGVRQYRAQVQGRRLCVNGGVKYIIDFDIGGLFIRRRAWPLAGANDETQESSKRCWLVRASRRPKAESKVGHQCRHR